MYGRPRKRQVEVLCRDTGCGERFYDEADVDHEGAAPPFGPPGGINEILDLSDLRCPLCGTDDLELA